MRHERSKPGKSSLDPLEPVAKGLVSGLVVGPGLGVDPFSFEGLVVSFYFAVLLGMIGFDRDMTDAVLGAAYLRRQADDYEYAVPLAEKANDPYFLLGRGQLRYIGVGASGRQVLEAAVAEVESLITGLLPDALRVFWLGPGGALPDLDPARAASREE